MKKIDEKLLIKNACGCLLKKGLHRLL